ncbi:sarcosine oxidase subunit gamma [Agrobacterium vitis]|uniref:Sarcosine oxidase subunit gamma n=1 Tax=Agrobacterium vitis TaxID=373 RepID=A0A6L6VI20_AGRVI|nr:sarcosine oxidase subunit gamma family protein [Agrobacterium vitis]MUZ74495.1 sarcosine oxidase subunit gamma [Agrobacterium vitis]
MSEFELLHRSAIKTNSSRASDAFSLKALPESTIIHVLGRPCQDLNVRLQQRFAADYAVRFFGPGQWLVVKDEETSTAELAAMVSEIHPEAFAVDQSHGRVRLEIDGSAARAVLAKGTAVDLDGMELGGSATTLMGHISVHITRTGQNRFELIVLRGFAQSLWDEITHLSAEF